MRPAPSPAGGFHAALADAHPRLPRSAVSSKGPSANSPRITASARRPSGARSGCAKSRSSKSAKAAAQDAERRRIEESIAIANVIPERAVIVILDERGTNLDSATLAAKLREWRAQDRPAACFIIGGADGLAASLRERANLKLAFGTATWPHQLVRVMLLEQIYRAGTILAGHPYHRA